MSINYKKVFAMKAEREKKIKSICPTIPCTSGIYAFYRSDEAGIRRSYVGQAVNLLERCASHLSEYDHIALSLKKHGFYSDENPYGWKLTYKTCSKSEMDDLEVSTIRQWADAGFQMYNVTAGSQGKGKQVTGQYKQPRTYSEGIQQGKKVLARELSNIAEKHLKIELRADKANNKVSQKQYEKFMELLKVGESDEQ